MTGAGPGSDAGGNVIELLALVWGTEKAQSHVALMPPGTISGLGAQEQAHGASS